jgi:hypothetical protein
VGHPAEGGRQGEVDGHLAAVLEQVVVRDGDGVGDLPARGQRGRPVVDRDGVVDRRLAAQAAQLEVIAAGLLEVVLRQVLGLDAVAGVDGRAVVADELDGGGVRQRAGRDVDDRFRLLAGQVGGQRLRGAVRVAVPLEQLERVDGPGRGRPGRAGDDEDLGPVAYQVPDAAGAELPRGVQVEQDRGAEGSGCPR